MPKSKVHAVDSEIEHAQVRLITAANAQMLFHYWKMGNLRKNLLRQFQCERTEFGEMVREGELAYA